MTTPAAAESPEGMAGTGMEGDPYVITNATQLQAMEQELDAYYVLGNDIDASNTSTWNGGNGFDPVGDSTTKFSGTFDGAGHAVIELTIDRSSENNVGVFGISNGSISNATIENVSIIGSYKVGGLVGDSAGTVTDLFASGTVTSGSYRAGGLIGSSSGTVNGSSAAVSVDGGNDGVGGLVGVSSGTITESYATGNVTGSTKNVGGLVGTSSGIITESYATGNVTGSDNNVGGLVGKSSDTITGSYATGNVTSSSASGGLVGYSTGTSTITGSYATGTVTVTSWYTGGLVGISKGTVNTSYATGNVSGGDYVGGLAGYNDGSINTSYATGDVSGSSNVAGVIGINYASASNSYWDKGTTNQDIGANNNGVSNGAGFGSTSDTVPAPEMQGDSAKSNMSAFDFDTVWKTTSGYPGLRTPGFYVSIDGINAPVVEGGDLLVNATVENTDDVQSTQDIVLAVNGTQKVTQSVTIGGGSTTAVNFTYTTQTGDAPAVEANISSDDDFDNATTSVQTPANFSVAINGTNSPVTDGEILSVDVNVTNLGEATATKAVNLSDLGGVEQDSVPVTLAGGTSNDSITLTWATTTDDAGTGPVTVATPDDTNTSQVEVLTPGNFSVEIVDTNSPVAGGQALTASLNVTNLGETTAMQLLNLTDFDETEQNNVSVSLDGGQSNESVTLTWATTAADNGSDTITVSSPNASDTATVTINDETAPTVDAGPDQTIDEDTETSFNGTATDAVGVTGYWWHFGDGNTSTGQNVTHSYADPGNYAITLNASDAAGNNGTDTLAVSVNDTTPPTAVAGSNQTVDEDTAVSFDGSNSTDNVGIDRYNWTFDDGTNATGATPSHTFDDPGTYTVTLNASDAASNHANDSVVLTVRAVSSGGGGGGSGGGGGGAAGSAVPESGQRITVESLTPADDETTTGRNRISIENARANTQISIDVNGDESPAADGDESGASDRNTDSGDSASLDESGQPAQTDGDVVMNRIEMTVNRGGSYDLEVQTRPVKLTTISDEQTEDSGSPTADLSSDALSETESQFVGETGARPSGYVQIDHTIPNSDVSDVTLRFRVRKSYLSATGVEAETVQLFRDEPTGWRALSTQQVGETDEYYRFAAESPGLSLFTIGTASPVFEIENVGRDRISETVTVGDAATVAVTVRNVGSADGQFTWIATANGDPLNRGSVSVPVGANRSIELGGVLEQAGTTELAVNGRAIGSVEVLQIKTPDGEDSDQGEVLPEILPESDPNTTNWMVVLLGIGLVLLVGTALVVRRS